MSQTVIVACGNPLRGDDGIALHIACSLRERYCDPEVEIRCAQQWTPELAERISKADLAIFVDASATIPAGEIQLQPVPSAKDWPGATNLLSPAQLLTLARELYEKVPERAFLLTIGGESFGHGEEFSRPVPAGHPCCADEIRALISATCRRQMPCRLQ